MRTLSRSILFFIIALSLLASCRNTGGLSPEQTSPPPGTGEPTAAASQVPNSESPASGFTAKPSPSPEETPEHTPEPIIVLPIEVILTEYEFNDDEARLYIKMAYPDITAYEEGSAGHKLAEDVFRDTKEYDVWIRSMAEQYPFGKDQPSALSYGFTSIPEVWHNGTDYFSMTVIYHTYTGGAHGSAELISYNYDKYGNRITDFNGILNRGITQYDVEAAINRQMQQIIEDMGHAFYKDTLSFSELESLPSFFIRDGKMVIYFQQYEIAAYAYGIPMFEMPSSIFNTEQ